MIVGVKRSQSYGEKIKILVMVRCWFWCNKVIIGLIYGRNLFALDLVDFLFGGNCSDIRFPATSYFPYKDTSFRGGFIWRGILYGSNISHWAIYWGEGSSLVFGWIDRLGVNIIGGWVRGLITDLQIRVKVALWECEGRLSGEKIVRARQF